MDNHKIAQGVTFYTQKVPDKLVDLLVEELTELEKHANLEEMENAQVGGEKHGRTDYDVRNSKLHWWYEDHWACSIFSHYIGIANKNIWEYDLNLLESIQITLYNEGGHYAWHSDYGTSKNKDFTRKLSASLLVTDPLEYEGGDLELWGGGEWIRQAPRGKGNVVVFPSYLMHRVKPITKGTRKSFVLWVGGQHYK